MPLFTEINRLKAALDTLRPLAPEQEQRVLQKFRLEWNYNSNAIEGNSLTLGETRSLLLHGLTAAGKPMRDHLDIKGHNEAVLWLEDFVRDERPLTEQFIRGMHEVLLGEAYQVPAQTPDGQPTRKTIQPGQYKTSPNNVLTATGEMFYFASPEETPAKMTELVDWYRQEDAMATMHPVALAAEFHYRFVRIHPFDDGNGRMSRLLMNLILLRHGYPMTVIKATDRNPYLAALAEADAGEFEPFLRFIIENVEAGLRLMIRAAKGKSIDEPDDLDKKLALLKKEILSRQDKLEMVWSLETQAKIWNNLLNHWFENLVSQLSKFNELFLSKKLNILLIDLSAVPGVPNKVSLPWAGFAYNADDNLTGALEFANEQLINRGYLFHSLYFRFIWIDFRMPDKIFSTCMVVSFKFNKLGYEVSYDIGETNERPTPSALILISKDQYKTEYDHTQIHEINHQLANKVYDFIATKVAEADSTPS